MPVAEYSFLVFSTGKRQIPMLHMYVFINTTPLVSNFCFDLYFPRTAQHILGKFAKRAKTKMVSMSGWGWMGWPVVVLRVDK